MNIIKEIFEALFMPFPVKPTIKEGDIIEHNNVKYKCVPYHGTSTLKDSRIGALYENGKKFVYRKVS